MAVWLLICVALRDKGVLRNTVNMEHYHDLGKWMFAMTIFWAYIAFSQYLLIWYANIPEETIWFRHRFAGIVELDRARCCCSDTSSSRSWSWCCGRASGTCER